MKKLKKGITTEGGHVQSQVAVEIATRLRTLTGLASVHVIPMGTIGFEGSQNAELDYGANPFSERLGALSANFIGYELAFSMVVKCYRQQLNVPFRIGVAAGSTVRAIVDDFKFPRSFIPKLSKKLTVQVCPLAIGPIPETTSSAGFIANSLSKKLKQMIGKYVADVQFVPLAEKIPHEDGYLLKMRDDIKSDRDQSPRLYMGKKNSSAWENSKMRFDWILTGVGANNRGQLAEHIDLRFKKDRIARQDVIGTTVGDICSRLYSEDGGEIDTVKGDHGEVSIRADGDRFVGISFEWLQHLSKQSRDPDREHRVVAVTGGEEKYDAIRTLARNSNRQLRNFGTDNVPCCFNSLVTDEFTARRLLQDLTSYREKYRAAEMRREED